MDAEKRRKIDALLERQNSLAGRWQLTNLGCTDGEIDALRERWRDVHCAVYVSGHGPLTQEQRHRAATLTEPDTALARWSLVAHHGLRLDGADDPIHVVREGSGGHRRFERGDGRLDALDLRYSKVLGGDLEERDGVLGTTLPRAMLDLCMPMSRAQRDRLFRDAIRLKRTTRDDLRAISEKHRGHRGNGRLRELLSYYEEIPIERTRSDPEIEALLVFRDAGLRPPEVNVMVAGFECDFLDPERRVIFELDGPANHQLTVRDEERNEAWAAAGYEVQRRPTADAYTDRRSIIRGMRGEPPA